MSKMCM
nr:BLTX414 [Nephila pilipes]